MSRESFSRPATVVPGYRTDTAQLQPSTEERPLLTGLLPSDTQGNHAGRADYEVLSSTGSDNSWRSTDHYVQHRTREQTRETQADVPGLPQTLNSSGLNPFLGLNEARVVHPSRDHDQFERRNWQSRDPERNHQDECAREPSNPFSAEWGKWRVEKRVPFENDSRPKFEQRPHVLPSQFDGLSNWDDYMVQFELISELNNWSDDKKSLYLAASLKGQARAILNDLDHRRRRDYRELTAA
ncbi:hypothetical protein BSL78_26355 [Apostichopus japonicus]|uniref:Uncharacterized protein n=1 Tax=Stichopus japonicus TaxID=307972 RepID=A0A2G8JM75_STIJA|nr:hypothetical protein BSL78_26355 [Apostichopus japonicus]